jgi:protocatechuate 3,4-dioxygenase beta subunit
MPLGRTGRSIVVVIALLLLSPAFSFAQKDTGSIVGYVGDEHGAPLAGAKVTLTNADAKQAAGQSTGASTDGTGQFRFEGLNPGRYTLLFESKGMVARTETVRVKVAHKTSVNERLRPPAVPKKPDND